MAFSRVGWRLLMPGLGRFARLVAAGALACGAVVAMTAPALGQPPSWSVVPSPNGPPADELDGVSCVSVTACTAVGFSGGGTGTLVESWNGTSWSVVPSPNGPPADELDGVSCVSVTACTAVGFSGGGAGTLVESWNGTSWSVVPSPSPVSTQPEALRGVSCVSAAACTAVGDYFSDGYKTLAESWNGTSWSVVPTPRTPGQGAQLNAVSCVSATTCTAVGYYYGVAGIPKTLAESWNGTSWSVVPTPHPPPLSSSSYLYGVSCVSVAACTAVGSHENSSRAQRVLVESWNGTSWSVVPTPNAGRIDSGNVLTGVSCVSATDCTAAGGYYNWANNSEKTLVESWDGTSWSVVPSANAGLPTSFNLLNGVSCVSAAACTAAGYFYGSHSPEKTLIESSS
jgi:hypothetical protein